MSGAILTRPLPAQSYRPIPIDHPRTFADGLSAGALRSPCAYSDVAPGEVEALLRVERSA